mgnify:CR=1 FL=1
MRHVRPLGHKMLPGIDRNTPLANIAIQVLVGMDTFKTDKMPG